MSEKYGKKGAHDRPHLFTAAFSIQTPIFVEPIESIQSQCGYKQYQEFITGYDIEFRTHGLCLSHIGFRWFVDICLHYFPRHILEPTSEFIRPATGDAYVCTRSDKNAGLSLRNLCTSTRYLGRVRPAHRKFSRGATAKHANRLNQSILKLPPIRGVCEDSVATSCRLRYRACSLHRKCWHHSCSARAR